jgi:hypothetical protein
VLFGIPLAEVLLASLLGKNKSRQGQTMANRNWMSNKMYQMEAYPVLLTCNFVVDSTNGNGLGIRSLKGGGIKSVYMKTTQPPAAGNPNPKTGVILVQLQDNYNKALLGMNAIVSKTDGANTNSTTSGRASVITALGTATLAQWQAVGVPVGVTPAVGVCFRSKSNTSNWWSCSSTKTCRKWRCNN